jgi:hypothetical protein
MKNKQIFTILIVVLIGIFTAQAQNGMDSTDYQKMNTIAQNLYKHEIGVSCGLFATPIIIPMIQGIIPNFNLSYYYNINKHHAIGVTLSVWIPIILDFPYKPRFPVGGAILIPQISYRVSYCQKKIISLYSVASLGWKINIGLKLKDNLAIASMIPFPAVHVTFIGMRIGNQQDAATIELGYGTQGIIIFGYSHKFMSKKK